jgi:hypothetical protein
VEKGFVTPFFADVVGRTLLVKGVSNPFSIFACASGVPQILVRGSIVGYDLHRSEDCESIQGVNSVVGQGGCPLGIGALALGGIAPPFEVDQLVDDKLRLAVRILFVVKLDVYRQPGLGGGLFDERLAFGRPLHDSQLGEIAGFVLDDIGGPVQGK